MKKIIIIVLVVIAGCFVYNNWIDPSEEHPATSQVVVVANCSNSKAVAQLDSAEFQSVLAEGLKGEGSSVKIMRGGGSTTIVGETYAIDYGALRNPSDEKVEQLSNKVRKDAIEEMKKVQATEPENDVVESVFEGSLGLDASADVKQLLIVNNMIPTKGVINFTRHDYSVSVEEVVARLKDADAIPNLKGVDVYVYGCGSTAAPQNPLAYEQKSYLIDFWKAFFEAAGAKSIEINECADTENVPDTELPKVTPVEVLDSNVTFSGVAEIYGDEICFIGDKADFVDKEKAMVAVEGIAEYVNSSDREIIVYGCTATGNDTYCNDLGQKRAEAVKNLLVNEFSVDQDKITAVGLGDKAPDHVVDTDADGNLIESQAYKNRRVVVIDPIAEPEMAKDYANAA